MPTINSLAWKTSLRKVGTLWHCSRLRSVALYLWLIVVISVRQSAVAAISGFTARRWLWSVRACRAETAWLQNSKKRAEQSEIDVWAESHTYLHSGYLSPSSPCHGLLIITVVTWPTKPSATKCQRTEAGERGNYWHADASAWCCCARCKIHEGISWC